MTLNDLNPQNRRFSQFCFVHRYTTITHYISNHEVAPLRYSTTAYGRRTNLLHIRSMAIAQRLKKAEALYFIPK